MFELLNNNEDNSEFDILEVDDTESLEYTSTSDSDDCECNHYNAMINLNGLSKSILLDLIALVTDKAQ